MAYERFWEAVELYEALTSSDVGREINRLLEEPREEFRRAATEGRDIGPLVSRYGELFRIASVVGANENNDQRVASELVGVAIALFNSLFEHCPVHDPYYRPPMAESTKELLEELFGRPEPPPPPPAPNSIGSELRSWVPSLDVEVGAPIYLPTPGMLDRLRALELPDISYQPDASERGDELLTALIIRAATLLVEYLLNYEDDWPGTHHEVRSLFARCDGAGLESAYADYDESDAYTLPRIRSLSKYLTAALAYQRGDYVDALLSEAKSIYFICKPDLDILARDGNDALVGMSSISWVAAPWLNSGRIGSCIEHIEHLRSQTVRWPDVIEACELLSIIYANYDDLGNILDRDAFWSEKKGWAESQLTPDQLRDYLQSSEDERAAQRLQTYFFPRGLWERLPERAREALVSADRVMMSSTLGRRAGILNEIRIATEEVLHRYLWTPLSEWAAAQRSLHSGVKEILGRPEQSRRSPIIDDYVQLLWHSGARDYFRSLGLSDDDVRFLTRENRTTKHLQTLQRTRNTAEHEPGSAINPSEVRDLYAESLGIGRKGILPELLRLLATGKRGGG